MKITLVQRIYNIINPYKSAFYDINLAINVVSWSQNYTLRYYFCTSSR